MASDIFSAASRLGGDHHGRTGVTMHLSSGTAWSASSGEQFAGNQSAGSAFASQAGHHRGDVHVVFFQQHHHVPVAVDAASARLDPRRLHACAAGRYFTVQWSYGA